MSCHVMRCERDFDGQNVLAHDYYVVEDNVGTLFMNSNFGQQ